MIDVDMCEVFFALCCSTGLQCCYVFFWNVIYYKWLILHDFKATIATCLWSQAVLNAWSVEFYGWFHVQAHTRTAQ